MNQVQDYLLQLDAISMDRCWFPAQIRSNGQAQEKGIAPNEIDDLLNQLI